MQGEANVWCMCGACDMSVARRCNTVDLLVTHNMFGDLWCMCHVIQAQGFELFSCLVDDDGMLSWLRDTESATVCVCVRACESFFYCCVSWIC